MRKKQKQNREKAFQVDMMHTRSFGCSKTTIDSVDSYNAWLKKLYSEKKIVFQTIPAYYPKQWRGVPRVFEFHFYTYQSIDVVVPKVIVKGSVVADSEENAILSVKKVHKIHSAILVERVSEWMYNYTVIIQS